MNVISDLARPKKFEPLTLEFVGEKACKSHIEINPGRGPATLIGKFASPDPTSRAFGGRSEYNRSEIGFYRELAPRKAFRGWYTGYFDAKCDRAAVR